jgi:uncharacterized protein
MIFFDFDPMKASSNLAKHRISFEEACTVFSDPLAYTFYDTEHSEVEQRFIIMGQSSFGQLLMVSYTTRDLNYRIISARKATRIERKIYEYG